MSMEEPEEMSYAMLIKFVDPQFSKTTMEGNFYFARNQYFIDLENKQKNEGIADKHEGSWSFLVDKDEEIYFESLDGKEKIVLPINPKMIHMKYDVLGNIPICCFVYLTIKDDFEKLPDERSYKLKSEIEDSLKKQFAGREMIVFF